MFSIGREFQSNACLTPQCQIEGIGSPRFAEPLIRTQNPLSLHQVTPTTGLIKTVVLILIKKTFNDFLDLL